MVIVDTSAWIEFLRRDPDNLMRQRVEACIRDDSLSICDAVRMEVLAGARDDIAGARMDRTLARARVIETTSTHYTLAASLYRACRRRGETVRSMIDCLIAAVAIESDLPILHADRDFEVLARHTPLRVV